MTFGQTRFRDDLVVLRQDSREGVQFVVKDPATGRFFRLGEAEYYIIQQLDGETPHEVIQRGVEQKFSARLSVLMICVLIFFLRLFFVVSSAVAPLVGVHVALVNWG